MNARSIILVAPLALAASVAAHALGIVRAPSSVTLGAPLNFPVSVAVGGDESINTTCITAEVYQGEQRIAPSAVRMMIEQGAGEEQVVRVYSTVAIEEPVVTVTLTLGCAIRLERRFTVFADPPLVTVAAVPEQPEPARVEAPIAAPPQREAPASEPRAAAAAAAPGGGTAAAPAPRSTGRPAARPTRSAAAGAAGASTPARRPVRTAAAAPAATQGATAAAGARGGAAPPVTTPTGPRLKLDPLEPIARSSSAASAAEALQEAQLRVAAMAASAAIAEQAASAALASAASAGERMRALEQGLEKLRADAERDREQTAALRVKLAQAETSARLTPWLGVGMVALAVLALWLWMRTRRLQREQQAAWWAATKGAAAGKAPPNPPTLQPMTLPPQAAPPPLVRPEATVTVKAPAAQPVPPKPAFRDSLFASQQEPRDVSIEELIDLEQQAEFFSVLGQDDAAIDLLMGHIRSSGGTSPLPYLKLLEIYRRQRDRGSYERTRERFNHRFNAYAPDWDSDLQHGRSLDEYPGVMQRLVARWPEPLDAMAELEALMFRRDGGELFELPAYREVLFLYSMARDLLDHQGGPPTAIDVLLPLDDRGQDFEPTTARPHLFTTPTGLAEFSRTNEPPIEVLRSSWGSLGPNGDPPSVYGTIDVDLTKPLPMSDDTQVLRRDDDQPSDLADLPPPKPKS